MVEKEITYRRAELRDSKEILKIYENELPTPVYKLLGKNLFLFFLERILELQGEYSIVAEVSEKIVGFLITSKTNKSFLLRAVKSILKNFIKILIHFFEQAFNKPFFFLILCCNFLKFHMITRGVPFCDFREFGLAILPQYRGRDIFLNLIKLWGKSVKDKGEIAQGWVLVPSEKYKVAKALKKFFFVRIYKKIKLYNQNHYLLILKV